MFDMGTVSFDLPRTYGLVVLTAVMNWFILMWQALKVGTARKKFGVKYPALYENKDPSIFNCIQRAHQNSLEWNPGFLTFLFIGGLYAPITSAAAGVVYNFGRVYYAKGYYEGSPHKGLWGLYGIFYLLGATCYSAFRMIKG